MNYAVIQREKRNFRVPILGFVESNIIDSPRNVIRPLWAMFVASPAAWSPFEANLRLGHKMELFNEFDNSAHIKLEFLKSSGFRILKQKTSQGILAQVFLNRYFLVDPPSLNDETVEFVIQLPPNWEDEQPDIELGKALLLVRYLKSRFPYPLVRDEAFTRGLYAKCKSLGWLAENNRYRSQPFNLRIHQYHDDLELNFMVFKADRKKLLSVVTELLKGM